MTYKTKEIMVKAVRYDGTNADVVCQIFPSFTVSGNTLHSNEGMTVSPDTVVCLLDGGKIKLFKSALFDMLFEAVEDPTYHLGDDELKGAVKLKRKNWSNSYIVYKDVCWLLYEDDAPVCVYNFSGEDISADDWMIVA